MASTDREALIALFRSTGGAGWNRKDNWDTDAVLATWYGVEVNDQGRVVALGLMGNNLQGKIPASLGQLSSLQKLDLGWNNLSGPIPPDLGSLKALIHLDLSANHLSGPIPPELGNLSALQKLDLSGPYRGHDGLSGAIPKELGDLTELTGLALQRNQLSGAIPPELGNLAALQTLNLRRNQLSGTIPEALGNLSALKTLWLQNNSLKGAIPAQLGALKKLTWLSLSNNQLSGEIPASLGQLVKLDTLNLSQNKLSGHVPPQLGDLGALKQLFLSNNKLDGAIPPELGNLAVLEKVNLSGNQLSGIFKGAAQVLRDLQNKARGRLQIELLPGNQWKHPQTAIVQGGLGKIVEFWEAIERSGGTHSWKLKVVLVGAVRAGKTSLARGMVHGEPRLCDKDGRTKGVEVYQTETCNPDAAGKLELVFWDFAGHSEYYSTHQLFLSEGSLHLLVVDLKRFSENPVERGDLVSIWLDALQCRVPGANVLVIANKFAGWEGDHETILGELRSAVNGHLEAKRAELERARQHSSTTSKMLPNVLGVEAFSAADAQSLVDLRGKLAALASREDLFPSVGQVLPVSWVRVRAVLEAKRSGKDPNSEASRIGADAEGFPAASGRSGDAVKFLRWEDGVREWKRVVRALKLEKEIGVTPWDKVLRAFKVFQRVGRTDKAGTVFESAAGLLVREGAILLSGEVLYVEPTWINEVLRAILDHQLTDEMMEKFWEGELKTFVRDGAGAEYLELKKVHDKFCTTGTLTVGYLRFLWRNVGIGDEEIFWCVLATMSHHGVIFHGTPSRAGVEQVASELDDNSKLFVPVRLPSNILPSSLSECETLRRFQYRKELIYNIHQSYVPPSVLGLMMARFLSCEGVELSACWSRGAAFAMGGPEVLMYLNNSREGTSDKADVTVQVFGQELSGELDKAVKKVQETIEAVFAAYFSGLFVDLKRGHPRPVRGADAGLESIASWQAHVSQLADMLTIRLSGLQKLVDSIKDESMQGLGQVESVLGDVRRQIDAQVKGEKQDMPAEWSERLRSLESLVERNDGVMGRLDFLVAMVMAERAENISAPRFVCVLPPWTFTESRGLSPEEMDPSVWTTRFDDWRDDDFKDGKGFFETEMRVFPVCAFSGELVPCGHDGHGYRVKRARKWVQDTTSVVNALISAAEPLAAPAMGAAQLGAEHAAKKAQPGDSARFAGRVRNDGIGKDGLDQVEELKGPDYDSVRKFIHEMEIRMRMEINSKMRKVVKVRRGDPSIPDFIYFDEEMVQVQARDGDGAAQWVLAKHEDAWYKRMRPAASGDDGT